MSLRLYSYYRSSAAYRVRIALNYKKIDYELVPISLLKDINDPERLNYKKINPQGLVPLLEHNELRIAQSIAIMEYLEDVFPEPPLLPNDPKARAYVRQITNLIACDIHPVNNLRVLKYLSTTFKADTDQKNTWYRHWVTEGLTALEKLLSTQQLNGAFCYQDQLSLADITLVPQLYNAKRFDVPLEQFPLLHQIDKNCLKFDAFIKALPENQPDAKIAP